MPEPTTHEILAGLLEKLDSLNLEGAERSLMWAILAAARDSLQIVDAERGMSFQQEFTDAFTPGRPDSHSTDLPTSMPFRSLMIVK
jgi:hypothetical protein